MELRASTFRINMAIVVGLVRLMQSHVRNSWVQFGESANVVDIDEMLIDLLGPPGLACLRIPIKQLVFSHSLQRMEDVRMNR